MKRGKQYGPDYVAKEPTVREVADLVDRIRKHLRGKRPELQGAVLCDLVAMYVAGHHPTLRDDVLEIHINTVRALVPANEAALFAHYGGKPEGWDDPPPVKKGH